MSTSMSMSMSIRMSMSMSMSSSVSCVASLPSPSPTFPRLRPPQARGWLIGEANRGLSHDCLLITS